MWIRLWTWIHSMLLPSSSFESHVLGNSSEFKVIGAGLQRTGTFSVRIALTHLLGGKCYHGFTASMDSSDARFWDRAASGNVTDVEMKEFLLNNGFNSGVGEPISLFYEDLMRMFPKAKVLLTLRSPERWYESMSKAIIEPRGFLEVPPISWIFEFAGYGKAKRDLASMREKVRVHRHLKFTSWTSVEAGREAAIQFFQDWNERVIMTVPKDKLLIYDVRQGWEPLCKMLDLPIPDEPFPMINDSRTIELAVKISYWFWVIVTLLILLTISLHFRHLVSVLLRRMLRAIFSRWK